MKTFLIAVSIIFLYSKVKAQTQDLVWSIYDTSGKIKVAKFSVLTKVETDMAKGVEAFVNNRARLTLTDSGNYSREVLRKPDNPVLCLCELKKDTIYISATMGLMSGLGIITAIHKDYFATRYFEEADNTSVFKSKKSDTSYLDRISVSTVKQKLTLLKKPSFVANENIIGVFEGQFTPFYQLYRGAELTRNYKVKLFFKCRSRQR